MNCVLYPFYYIKNFLFDCTNNDYPIINNLSASFHLRSDTLPLSIHKRNDSLSQIDEWELTSP